MLQFPWLESSGKYYFIWFCRDRQLSCPEGRELRSPRFELQPSLRNIRKSARKPGAATDAQVWSNVKNFHWENQVQPVLGSVPPTPAGSGDDMQSLSAVDSADAALNADSIKHSFFPICGNFSSLSVSLQCTWIQEVTVQNISTNDIKKAIFHNIGHSTIVSDIH